jgi:Domain of unknown function (DUF4406)
MALSDIKSIVYLSGPMSGIKDYNKEAFNHAEAQLNIRGIKCINPWRRGMYHHDRPKSFHMRRDFLDILHRDTKNIVLLDGWENSTGARAEVLIAQEIGLPIYHFSLFERMDAQIITAVSSYKEIVMNIDINSSVR